MARLRRLPIRVKVTVALVALLSATLAAFGLGAYLHTKSSLDDVIRRELAARAADIQTNQSNGSNVVPPRDRVAQIVSADGRLLAGHPAAVALTRPEQARAFERPFLVDRTEATRIYARPGRGGTLIVVGISLHQREHALESLVAAFLVGGPIALLVAGAIAYFITGVALEPVEEMRRRAEAAHDPTVRLPLPPADDEIRRLGETLNHLLARVETAVELERSFVGNASHQLRTPLAVLRAELELARDAPDVPARVRSSLGDAIGDTDKLTDVVSRLLLLARADDGALPADLEEIDLAHLANVVAARHGLSPGARGPLLAVGDPQLTEQALENLVGNAFEHGGGAPEVAVHAADGYVCVTVADRGPGLPETFLPIAFNRFAQATPGAGGAGLGLAVARVLAERQGGSVVLRNRAGGGAEATLRLRAPGAS